MGDGPVGYLCSPGVLEVVHAECKNWLELFFHLDGLPASKAAVTDAWLVWIPTTPASTVGSWLSTRNAKMYSPWTRAPRRAARCLLDCSSRPLSDTLSDGLLWSTIQSYLASI